MSRSRLALPGEHAGSNNSFDGCLAVDAAAMTFDIDLSDALAGVPVGAGLAAFLGFLFEELRAMSRGRSAPRLIRIEIGDCVDLANVWLKMPGVPGVRL